MTRRTAGTALVVDLMTVVAFAAIGRRNHAETGNVVAGAFIVAAPFAIAMAVGWLAARAWREPVTGRTALIVWVVTVALGVLLRRFPFDRGTAASFVVVATIALGVLIVGWRAAYRWWSAKIR